MTAILFPVLCVLIIGVICALVLVVASTVMAVKEDPKMGQIRECLPGANCGACGYAGCDG
ncbi:MAG TPA: ferredoxin, partial [Candidatus Galloscillospira excrementavium]|nr:ferredoxin [Candidatus Galloscillospira excrementavium]